MLPDIHKPRGKAAPRGNAARKRAQPAAKQSADTTFPDARGQERVAWPGRDLLAQVLQLGPAEEEQLMKMIQGYTKFLKSQIMSDNAYARALEKEHVERSSLVFKLQNKVETLQKTLQVCQAPSAPDGQDSITERMAQRDHEIEFLEAEIAAVKAQAAAGKAATLATLKEERAVTEALQAQVLAVQAATKQCAKDTKAAQAELRRTQMAIARRHPGLGIYQAIGVEESYHQSAHTSDEEADGPSSDPSTNQATATHQPTTTASSTDNAKQSSVKAQQQANKQGKSDRALGATQRRAQGAQRLHLARGAAAAAAARRESRQDYSAAGQSVDQAPEQGSVHQGGGVGDSSGGNRETGNEQHVMLCLLHE